MKNIVGAATTLLKSDGGTFHRIIVNDGTGTNVATIYDNIIAAAPTIATLNVDKLQGSVEFGGVFSTGLTVVTTGATTNITVIWD